MCVKANAASGEDASTHLGGSRRLAEDLAVRSSWPWIVDLYGQKINVFHAMRDRSVKSSWALCLVWWGALDPDWPMDGPIEINLGLVGFRLHRSSSRKQRKS